jgi:transcriptional regulator with XRE-family HTH domain
MEESKTKQIIASNIRNHMALQGKKRTDVCHDTGIKYTTLRDWLEATTCPRVDALETLANYFNVSVAALLSESGFSTKPFPRESKDVFAYYEDQINRNRAKIRQLENQKTFLQAIIGISAFCKVKSMLISILSIRYQITKGNADELKGG